MIKELIKPDDIKIINAYNLTIINTFTLNKRIIKIYMAAIIKHETNHQQSLALLCNHARPGRFIVDLGKQKKIPEALFYMQRAFILRRGTIHSQASKETNSQSVYSSATAIVLLLASSLYIFKCLKSHNKLFAPNYGPFFLQKVKN